jgi:hypothetical protein
MEGRTDATDAGLSLPSVDDPQQPITLSVRFSAADVARLDATRLTIRHWDDREGWQNLKTTVDLESGIAVAEATELGRYSLYAPLACLTDNLEPDDHYAAAPTIPVPGGLVRRSLDVAEDNDWFRVHIKGGRLFVAQVAPLAQGVEVILSLHHPDTLATLALSNSQNRDGALQIRRRAEVDGQYLLRVRRAGESISGCEATYGLRTSYIYALEKLSVSGPEAGLIGQSYTFTATIDPVSATQPITYSWQVTDQRGPETALVTSSLVTATWSATGTHQIVVTATNEGGAITAAHNIAIHDLLVANFAASPLSGSLPLKVTFTNTSREGYEESFWDFGDGKTSRREHPIHTYRSAGVYTVTLTVSALGGSDVITRSQYIAVAEDVQPVQGEYSVLMPLVLRSR